MRLILFMTMSVIALGCTSIEADRIVGKDFAAANPSFAGIPASLDFGPAPVAGTVRTFRAAELARIGKAHELAIPASVELCFERASFTLKPDALRETLSRVLNAEVEVLDYSRTPLPIGKLEFPRDTLSATGLWRGRLLYGENRSVPVWARVRVTDSESGKLLTVQRTAPAAEINRGQTVRVEVTSGGVLLAFDGAAESSGHVGEAITVRNPANGQRLRAIVEAKGKASIHK